MTATIDESESVFAVRMHRKDWRLGRLAIRVVIGKQ